MLFMGREVDDWVDIYQLLVFRNEEIKSLWDLRAKWRPPESPSDCLKIGLELVEAKKAVDPTPIHEMMMRAMEVSTKHPTSKWIPVKEMDNGSD